MTAASACTVPSGSKTNRARVQQDSTVPVSRSLSERGPAGSRLEDRGRGTGDGIRPGCPGWGAGLRGPCVLRAIQRLAHTGEAHFGGNRESQQAQGWKHNSPSYSQLPTPPMSLEPQRPHHDLGMASPGARHRGEDQEAHGFGSVKFYDH